jgi:hypothetical protein
MFCHNPSTMFVLRAIIRLSTVVSFMYLPKNLVNTFSYWQAQQLHALNYITILILSDLICGY